MARPKFSVVIPTYNRARLIERALRCVVEQSVHPAEIIVVDDGSTDQTADVVAGFGPAVKYLQQQHGGPSRARNHGVANATGEWIAFLDSDDLWHSDYLERMDQAIVATDGKASLYFSNAVYDFGTYREDYWTKCGFLPSSPIMYIPDGSSIGLRPVQPMLLPFAVFKRDAYLRLGGLWEELWSAEDTHFFIRIALTEPLCAVNTAGGVVTADEVDPSNRITISHGSGTTRRWVGVVKMYNDLLRRDPPLKPEHVRVLRSRLADSQWRLSRMAWQRGDHGQSIAHLLKCVWTDPREIVRTMIRAAKRTTEIRTVERRTASLTGRSKP